MTQEELAERLNVSRSTVANWERGIRGMDDVALVSFANQFDVTTDYILRGDRSKLRFDLARQLGAEE